MVAPARDRAHLSHRQRIGFRVAVRHIEEKVSAGF